MKNTIKTFWDRVDKTGACWIWQGRPSGGKPGQGYGWFQIDGVIWKAHRFSYHITRGPIPQGMYVCHSCDTPLCVNPDHLWLGTLQDNHRDMMQKGRHGFGRSPGSRNKSAKLTEQQVLEIRALPGPNRLIAEKYGVSKCTIDQIKTRDTWRHI